MTNLPSAFKSPKGETEYMAAYEATMQLWNVPYEDRFVSSRFGSTHLVVCGPKDAPPLVLLHCYFLTLASWAYNIAALSRNYRVYAPDVMGQPSKSIPNQPIRNREELAEWLTSTLDALEIRQTDLIGYSFGGFAALNYAIWASDRIKKLVILCPAGGLMPLKAGLAVRGALNTLTSIFLPSLTPFTARMVLHFMTYGPSLKNEDTKRLFDRMSNQLAISARYFRVGPQVVPAVYTDEELRSIKNSTLLLIGRQETIIDPVAAVERAKRLIPDIKAEIIPEAGHELPISYHDMVNKKVLEFLRVGQEVNL